MADNKQEILDYKAMSDSITLLFVDKKVPTIEKSIELLSDQFSILQYIFDSSSHEEDKQYACRMAITVTMDYLLKMLKSPKVEPETTITIWELHQRVYAFAGRRSFKHFIEHMESDRAEKNKVFFNRKDVLASPVYYLNKMAFDPKMNKFVLSIFPGAGKSFLLNYFTAWCYGLNRDNSVLRMSYSDDLLNGFSRQIKDLISSDLYADIFPDFKIYRNKPFDKEKDSDWKLKNSDSAVSHYVRTRDGATTGIRARFAIEFDDMIKGADEAHNDEIHEQYWKKYTTEWWNRRERDTVKYIFAGTMWTPKDLLNRITDLESTRSKVKQSKLFKYTWVSEDGHAVFIRIPLLDSHDESTCPYVMSTNEARNLKEITDPFLFSCVYQQDPIAPSGMEFAYENLRTFNKVPKEGMNNHCYAVLDPTRKGKDNVSMPIFKVSTDGEDHYLIDVLYKRKAMTEVHGDIVNMIIQHQITQFCVENNTDTSLKTLLLELLRKKGYTLCEITEKFNTAVKEVRIKDARGLMLRKMIFKEKGTYAPNTDYGRFMDAFTKYSFDYANKHDDAPDSLALYVNEIILDRSVTAKVTFMSRADLGI